MDPETLVTFLFKAPPQVRTVELLGSWDNFTHPYRMHHDRRRGTGSWSGCFRFANIVFDGDTADWNKPRSGGLKQGGVYWYYYRLDDAAEAYDDRLACTPACPLMPGQMMNVLDVPSEIPPPPSRARSVCVEGLAGTLGGMATALRQQTMEPSDKFAALEPPPVSRVHGRCLSDMALNARLENRGLSSRKSVVSPRGTEAAQVDPLDHRPGKRRCSGDRPDCSGSSTSEQSVLGSYHLASDVEAYAAHSPIPEPHPDPLRSLPVDEETLSSFRLGLEAFEFGPAQASASAGNHEKDKHDDESEHGGSGSAYGPASVHNVQMYGSPMTKACDTDQQWRPGLHSLPSESLIEWPARGLRGSCSPASAPATSAMMAENLDTANLTPLDAYLDSQPPIYSPSNINNVPEEHGATLGNTSPPPLHHAAHSAQPGRPDSEPCFHDQDDLWFPTFSAATVSSNGLDTPFRLSAGYPHDATASQHTHDPPGLDDITRRLQSLGGRDTTSPQTSPPPQPPPGHERSRPDPPFTPFTAYALPASAIQSASSLDKLSSSRRTGSVVTRREDLQVCGTGLRVEVEVEVEVEGEGSGNSMAEEIFSELAYLGASIT